MPFMTIDDIYDNLWHIWQFMTFMTIYDIYDTLWHLWQFMKYAIWNLGTGHKDWQWAIKKQLNKYKVLSE